MSGYRVKGNRRFVTVPVKKRFWDKVLIDDSDKCWEWQGYKNPRGYGQIGYKGAKWYVHRLCYSLYIDEIPEGMHVCHHCDNPSCVNPGHLFLGTNNDNVQDAVAKGRIWKGDQIWASKLKPSDVVEMRRLHKTGEFTFKELAKKFPVDHRTAWEIVRRKTWKHI